MGKNERLYSLKLTGFYQFIEQFLESIGQMAERLWRQLQDDR
jgi:hypothetical protein